MSIILTWVGHKIYVQNEKQDVQTQHQEQLNIEKVSIQFSL